MSVCNCHSYNWEVGEEPEVILKAPDGYGTDTICVDACIAGVIQHLWDNGVVTQSSCCGHGSKDASIVLDTNITAEQASGVARLIAEVDQRKFDLKAWLLHTFDQAAD